MRLIFAGTPAFARVALDAIHMAGFEVALVLSQPDRPAGRGLKLQASEVKEWALAHEVPVCQPRSLRLEGRYPEDAAEAQRAIHVANADVMVVAAYGLILPAWTLAAPRLGCLNIHGSLLPRWRGAAPIHRAIEAGDAETGITIMQMDEGLDTGNMLLRQALPIGPEDTTATMHDQLARLGAAMVVDALRLCALGSLIPVKQPTNGVTYAAKIEKHEAALDWSQSAQTLARRIRAFNPFPGASVVLAGQTLKVWQAQALAADSPANLASTARSGQVVAVGDHGIDVATADGVLRLQRLQKPSGKALDAADFLRGFEVHTGMAFESAPASAAAPGSAGA